MKLPEVGRLLVLDPPYRWIVVSFATALLDADYVPDMIQVILRLDESIQHIDKDRVLLLSRARASLPVIRVMNAKSVL